MSDDVPIVHKHLVNGEAQSFIRLEDYQALVDEAVALSERISAVPTIVRDGTGSVIGLLRGTTVAEAPRSALEARELLRRLLKWDHLDAAADGPYWRSQIHAALQAEGSSPRPATSNAAVHFETAMRSIEQGEVPAENQRLAVALAARGLRDAGMLAGAAIFERILRGR